MNAIKFCIRPLADRGIQVKCESCKAEKIYSSMPIPKGDLFRHAKEQHDVTATEVEQISEVICPRMYFVEVRAA